MAGFNTNAVAVRAGVSIGSLYQYFPSKDAILLALMEQSLTLFSETLSQAIDRAPGESLGGDLSYMLQMGLMTHQSRPNLERLLEGEFRRLEGHINKASASVALREAVIRLLGRYGAALRVDSLEAAARDVGVIAKALMVTAAECGETDWDAVIARSVRAMLGYLSVAASTRPAPLREPARLGGALAQAHGA